MTELYVRPNFVDYVVEVHITIRGTQTFFSIITSTKISGPIPGENNGLFIKLT